MKTKDDLVKALVQLEAARGFIDYVREAEGSAREILKSTERLDWLEWVLGKLSPDYAPAYARGCLDRYMRKVKSDGVTYKDEDRMGSARYLLRACELALRSNERELCLELAGRVACLSIDPLDPSYDGRLDYYHRHEHLLGLAERVLT